MFSSAFLRIDPRREYPVSEGSTQLEGFCDVTLVHTAFFTQKENLSARLREAWA